MRADLLLRMAAAAMLLAALGLALVPTAVSLNYRQRRAWMSGLTEAFDLGEPGTLNVSSTSNRPRAVNVATAQLDAANKEFYLFGGTPDSDTGYYPLNTFYRYRLNDSTWTWISGTTALSEPSTGSLGIPSTSASPGARLSAMSWFVPESREFWLLGGFGYHSKFSSAKLMPDLWRYHIANKTWTLMSIAGTLASPILAGDYGQLGVAAPTNQPPARRGACTWYDASNRELWMYGGGFSDPGYISPFLNDVWKYSLSSNLWTWVAGPNGSSVCSGLFAGNVSLGIDNPGLPGGRNSPACAWDPINRQLFMFGGRGCVSGVSSPGHLADTWKFQPDSLTWTYLGGATTTESSGNGYSNPGVSSRSYYPRARMNQVQWWDPANSVFSIWGGAYSTGWTVYDDLWRFNASDSTWTFISGTTLNGRSEKGGTYETKGVFSTSNSIGARGGSAYAYDPQSRELWQFGGNGNSANGFPGLLNDLWIIKDFEDCSNYVQRLDGPACIGIKDGDDVTVTGSFSNLNASVGFPQCQQIDWPTSTVSACGSPECVRPGACPPYTLSEAFNTTDLLCYTDGVSVGQCPPNHACDGTGTCKRLPGQTCAFGSDCLSGTCGQNGVCCSAACSSSCDSTGACKLDLGSQCADSSECVGGLCTESGYCCAYNCSVGYSCVGSSPCLAINGYGCRNRIDCLSSFCADNLVCCAQQCSTGEGCGPDLESCLLLAGKTCSNDTQCLSGHCGSNGRCCYNAGCSCNLHGECQSGLGGICGQDDDCYAGTCSAVGQCCSTACDGSCKTCASGSCENKVDGPEPLCPTVECSNLVSGWNGTDGNTCERFNSTLDGRCEAGACATSSQRCIGSANKVQQDRPSCGSLECRRNCTALESAASYATLGSVCLISLESCGPSKVCSPSGSCELLQNIQVGPPREVAAQSDNSVAIAVSITVIVVIAALAVGIALFIKRRREDARLLAQIEMSQEMKNMFNIKPSELEVLHKLGEGSFGVVYFGKFHNKHVAIKRLAVNVFADAIGDFFRESMLVMSVEKHPNVIHVYGMCQERINLSLIMEFIPNGSLESLVRNPEIQLSETEIWKLLHGIASGMASLAKQKIVHRDLACRNILLGEGNAPKVADFGFARVLGEEDTGKTASNVGPVRWMAPEALRHKIYSEFTDVWAYGCIILEILTHKVPFDGKELIDVAVFVRDTGQHAPIPDGTPLWIATLMEHCWAQQPSDRYTFAEIVTYLDENKPSKDAK